MTKRFLFAICVFLNVQSSFSQSLDLRLLEKINGPVSGNDHTWVTVSNSVNIVGIVSPCTMLTVGFIDHDKELIIKGCETAGAIIIAEGLNTGLKITTQRERPNIAHPDLITGKINETDYSFPSGHTSVAFATATSLSLSFPKWYVIAPSFIYASAIGYSRLYLGVHYPSDVLTGAALGTGSAFLSRKLQILLNKKYHYH